MSLIAAVGMIICSVVALFAGNVLTYGAGERRIMGWRSDLGVLIGLVAIIMAFFAGRMAQ